MEEQQQNLGDVLAVRREKLKTLQEEGKNPFTITKFDVTAHARDINEKFEEYEEKTVSIAGRIMAVRDFGKGAFISVQDRKGRIQAFIRKDKVGEAAFAISGARLLYRSPVPFNAATIAAS